LPDGSSLHAAQHTAEADYSAALAGYQQVFIKAFGQVADNLQALNHDAMLSKASESALASATGFLDRTEKTYSVSTATPGRGARAAIPALSECRSAGATIDRQHRIDPQHGRVNC
jgi:hypothetical protein